MAQTTFPGQWVDGTENVETGHTKLTDGGWAIYISVFSFQTMNFGSGEDGATQFSVPSIFRAEYIPTIRIPMSLVLPPVIHR